MASATDQGAFGHFRSAICAALCLLSVGVGDLARAGPLYAYTDLGTLSSASLDYSSATAINNLGQILGKSSSDGASVHDVLWNGTVPTDRGTDVTAYAINDSSQIAGQSVVRLGSSDWFWRATVWNGSNATVLGSLPDVTHSEALAINNAGMVAGRSIINPVNGHTHATVWNGNVPTDLGTGSGTYSQANGINSSGQVAGDIWNAAGSRRATIWNGTVPTDLGTLGSARSSALAINDAGDVVGYSNTVNGEQHAALWNGTGAIDLGTLGGTSSSADAINNAGQIVGQATTGGSTAGHAALWNGSDVTDLNSFLDADTIRAGWVLENAADINDEGWIVGYAVNVTSRVTHAFLLTPINDTPEPATLALLALGLAGVCFSRRKRT